MGDHAARDLNQAGRHPQRLHDPFKPEPVKVNWNDALLPGASFGDPAAGISYEAWGPSGSLLVPAMLQSAPAKSAYGTIQLPHGYKEGTDVHLHLHCGYPDTNAGDILFDVEWVWQAVREVCPAPQTKRVTIAASGVAWRHEKAELVVIRPTGQAKKISSVIIVRVTRRTDLAGDDYGSYIAFLSGDGHYEVDSLGSRAEYTK